MQKTKIEWADYTWNPVKGLCPQNCKLPDGSSYCYARAMYKRFKWDPKLRLDEKELVAPVVPRKPGRVFVGSTIELFHPKIPTDWIQQIIDICHFWTSDIFIFLTKNPARYAEFDFPKNCWLGTTITTEKEEGKAEDLRKVKNIKFVSYEPLLGVIRYFPTWIDWVIIGALTGSSAKKHRPHPYWINLMADACRNYSIPIFLKNNLAPIWDGRLIQEFPQEQ